MLRTPREVVDRLPYLLRKNLTLMLHHYRRWLYDGEERYCCVCESFVRKFLPFGYPNRANARCPVCGSLERHRFVFLFFQEKTNLFDDRKRKMLHIAPERMLEIRFREIVNLDYVSIDLSNPRAIVKMDITDLQFSDNSFDVIYCSHVLEHVDNDCQAMSELHRVLKPDGFVVIMVPIAGKQTFEDPSVTNPIERLRRFRRKDHMRRYGLDIKDRLKETKFEVALFSVYDIVEEDNLILLGLDKEEVLFYCKKW